MHDKLDVSVLESFSHWGLIETHTGRYGTLTIVCDYDGNPKSQYFEGAEEVMPLVLVVYEKRGMLAIMGNHATNEITGRSWFPEKVGAMPPHDAFSGDHQIVAEPTSATKH